MRALTGDGEAAADPAVVVAGLTAAPRLTAGAAGTWATAGLASSLALAVGAGEGREVVGVEAEGGLEGMGAGVTEDEEALLLMLVLLFVRWCVVPLVVVAVVAVVLLVVARCTVAAAGVAGVVVLACSWVAEEEGAARGCVARAAAASGDDGTTSASIIIGSSSAHSPSSTSVSTTVKQPVPGSPAGTVSLGTSTGEDEASAGVVTTGAGLRSSAFALTLLLLLPALLGDEPFLPPLPPEGLTAGPADAAPPSPSCACLLAPRLPVVAAAAAPALSPLPLPMDLTAGELSAGWSLSLKSFELCDEFSSVRLLTCSLATNRQADRERHRAGLRPSSNPLQLGDCSTYR